MGLLNTPSGERLHIGFFGMRNAGKSSLVNCLLNQPLCVVSDVKGTTTDPVKKAMELLPLGPVVIMDTPGLDDEGELGALRVQKTGQILSQTDLAVVVVDAARGLCELDEELLALLDKRKIPSLIVYNKADLLQTIASTPTEKNAVYASTLTGKGMEEIKKRLGEMGKAISKNSVIVSDLIEPGDLVLLVTPLDESAPKGRLILPQQMTIRDILDAHGIVMTCQDTEVEQTLACLKRQPKLVITDSQVFKQVSEVVPDTILLTSFSILMARYKGDLRELVKGANALSDLKAGDHVLISEGCTHHRQCGDIGTVKMPQWIRNYTKITEKGEDGLRFSFTSGTEFPEDLTGYDLIVHCGGCMLNETQMKYRIDHAVQNGVPIVNYGIAIAKMHGILKRSVEPFADIRILLGDGDENEE